MHQKGRKEETGKKEKEILLVIVQNIQTSALSVNEIPGV